MQMGQVTDVVGHDRAGRAALILAGEARLLVTPHEVVDDELAAALKQIQQACLPFWPGEDVFLDDLDHRQGAAGSIERVFRAAGFLLLGKQVFAGGQPLIWCCDLRKVHLFLLCRGGPTARAVVHGRGDLVSGQGRTAAPVQPGVV